MNVLIISANPFSKTENNGKTLESMFSSFKKEELFQLFTRPLENPDFDYANGYYLVSDKDNFNKLCLKSKECGRDLSMVLYNLSSTVDNKYTLTAPKPKLKRFRLFRDLLWRLDLWKNEDLKKWCKTTKADVVFLGAGGDEYLHRLSIYISEFLQIPLTSMFGDDYLIYPKSKGFLDKTQRFFMPFYFRKTVNKSLRCFCIGSMMSEAYEKYFAKEFTPIMNIVDIIPYNQPKRPAESDNKLVVSYFGGLHLNRWRMISRLAALIRNKCIVQVYTTSEITEEIFNAFNTEEIKVCNPLCGDKLIEGMHNSDILLHVESDDTYNRSFTHLAVSTKIPEYLIAGRAVVGFGPIEVASMRIISDNHLGLVISSEMCDKEIQEAFNVLLSYDKRCKYGKLAYANAVNNFDKKKISAAFKNQLESVCK